MTKERLSVIPTLALLVSVLIGQGCSGGSSTGASAAAPTTASTTEPAPTPGTGATTTVSTNPTPAATTPDGPETVTFRASNEVIAEMNPNPFADFRMGDPVTLEIMMNNGGKALEGRSWERADLARITIRSTSIDTGRRYTVIVEASKIDDSRANFDGGFETDIEGNLIRAGLKWSINLKDGVRVNDTLGLELENIQISGAVGVQTTTGLWIATFGLSSPTRWKIL